MAAAKRPVLIGPAPPDAISAISYLISPIWSGDVGQRLGQHLGAVQLVEGHGQIPPYFLSSSFPTRGMTAAKSIRPQKAAVLIPSSRKLEPYQ